MLDLKLQTLGKFVLVIHLLPNFYFPDLRSKSKPDFLPIGVFFDEEGAFADF